MADTPELYRQQSEISAESGLLIGYVSSFIEEYEAKSAKFFKKVLHFYFLCLYLQSQMKGNTNRGVAQLASASGLGPEGPVFESQYPDKAEAEMLPLFFL